MGTNNVFFALGSVSGLVSGVGKIPFVRCSFSEQEADARLQALRTVMHEKKVRPKS